MLKSDGGTSWRVGRPILTRMIEGVRYCALTSRGDRSCPSSGCVALCCDSCPVSLLPSAAHANRTVLSQVADVL